MNPYGQAGATTNPYATLKILIGPQQGTLIRMIRPTWTLGRKPLPEIDFAMPEASYVSSKHCTIRYESGFFTITDLNSSNGTYVDNHELLPHQAYALPDGATIQLGRTPANSVVLEFKRGGDSGLPAPATADTFQVFPATQRPTPTQRRDFLPAPLGGRDEPNDPYKNLTAPNTHPSGSQMPTLPPTVIGQFPPHDPGPTRNISSFPNDPSRPDTNVPSDWSYATYTPPLALSSMADQPTYRYVVGGLLMAASLLAIVGFFVFSWMDFDHTKMLAAMNNQRDEAPLLPPESLNTTDYSLSALDIWLGSKDNAILDMESVQSGISSVRPIDRVLVILPLLAILVVGLVGLYMQGHLEARLAFGLILTLVLLINAIPPLWQLLSSADWEQYLQTQLEAIPNADSTMIETLKDSTLAGLNSGYSYGEQTLLGGFMLMVSGIGLMTSIFTRKATS